MSLDNLQKNISESILFNDIEPIRKSINLEEKEIKKRIEIYHYNFFNTLIDTLRKVYPVVERLVGERFFIFLSKSYIKQHTPKKSNLNIYGNHMSEFIRNFKECNNVPYLSDVSKLEWARHSAYFARDIKSISIQALEKIPRNNLEKITVTFHPSISLIKSEFPIFQIWKLNQKGNNNFSGISLKKTEHGMVIRNEKSVINYKLNISEFNWLTFLYKKKNLRDASLEIYKTNASFNLEKSLSNMITLGAFTDFK